MNKVLTKAEARLVIRGYYHDGTTKDVVKQTSIESGGFIDDPSFSIDTKFIIECIESLINDLYDNFPEETPREFFAKREDDNTTIRI